MSTNHGKPGVVTVGGMFGQPDYPAGYFAATQLLMESGDVEALAMPILYLQRHTVELIIKSILTGAYSVIESKQQLQRAKGEPVLSFTIKPTKTHRLGRLLDDAERALGALEYKDTAIPGMRDLVNLIESLEGGDETRWRYDTLISGARSFPHDWPPSHSDRVALPIHEVQERLTRIVEEEQLGKWEEVMSATGPEITSFALSLAQEYQQIAQELY
ncbi:MAG TPA: hypothetical protein VM493_11475, partial [Vicinamibacterales bacterium]|nr:hypothetical protein [Vicinamibacterales bacterium]